MSDFKFGMHKTELRSDPYPRIDAGLQKVVSEATQAKYQALDQIIAEALIDGYRGMLAVRHRVETDEAQHTVMIHVESKRFDKEPPVGYEVAYNLNVSPLVAEECIRLYRERGGTK